MHLHFLRHLWWRLSLEWNRKRKRNRSFLCNFCFWIMKSKSIFWIKTPFKRYIFNQPSYDYFLDAHLLCLTSFRLLTCCSLHHLYNFCLISKLLFFFFFSFCGSVTIIISIVSYFNWIVIFVYLLVLKFLLKHDSHCTLLISFHGCS